MLSITIDILKSQDNPVVTARAAAARLVGRFTCNTGDFVLISQLHQVAAMVADVGLPPECVLIVNSFLFRSAASAANSFYKAMEVTVEAGDPGSILLGVDDGGSQAPVPPGPEAGESVTTTPCSHRFHRSYLDRWTAVNRSCPNCRGSVPSGKAPRAAMPSRPLRATLADGVSLIPYI
jgi:hypothetical protein